MAEIQQPQRGTSKKDIELTELSTLSWKTPQEIETSLTALYRFADGTGQKASDWYMRAKRPKQVGSRWLRLMAIFLVTLGGLMPIIISIVGGPGQLPWLAQMGYLALGLAAGCVILDKFFGFSSGWTRYITVAQELQAATSRFRFNWNMQWLALDGKALTPETAAPLIELAREFVAAVDKSVQQETQLWIAEFQAGLALVDAMAKSKSPEPAVVPAREGGPATTSAGASSGSGGNGTGARELSNRPSSPGDAITARG